MHFSVIKQKEQSDAFLAVFCLFRKFLMLINIFMLAFFFLINLTLMMYVWSLKDGDFMLPFVSTK